MKHLLVVDDEPAITRLLKLNLEATGNYSVAVLNRGSQVLAAMRMHKPDLVLLDIMMPDKLGNEVAAELQDDPAFKDIPVIFLTAILKKSEDEEIDHQIGSQTIVAKPIATEDLIKVIERVLAKDQR